MSYGRMTLAALAALIAAESALVLSTTSASAFNANPHANTTSGDKAGWTEGKHNPHKP